MKRLFIINPSSCSGMHFKEFLDVEKYFTSKLGEFPHVLTKSGEDIILQTRKALHQGVEQIIAVGGDGTIHGVINGFFEKGAAINPDALLAISRTGSGSDYFRTLIENSNQHDWKTIVTEYNIKEVDLGYVTFANNKKDQFFNNMASVGLSAEIVTKKDGLPAWCPTKLSYILPTLTSIIGYRPKKARIEVCGKTYKLNLLSLMVCKGLYAGGGMKFGANSKVDDGQFAITLIDRISAFTAIKNIKKLYTDQLSSIPEITKVSGNKLVFNSKKPIGVELDGEFIGEVNEFEISIVPKAIKVCFPKARN